MDLVSRHCSSLRTSLRTLAGMQQLEMTQGPNLRPTVRGFILDYGGRVERQSKIISIVAITVALNLC